MPPLSLSPTLTDIRTPGAQAEAHAAPSPGWKFQVIRDVASLQNMAPAWQQLLDASSVAAPMLGPDWLLTWWDIYGTDRSLVVGAWYADNELVGLAPMCLGRHWYRPRLPFRRLEFLGSDSAQGDGVCSNYLNLIARPGHEDRVAAAFVDALAKNKFGSWDECVLSSMDGSSALTQRVIGALQAAGLEADVTESNSAPYFPLPATWEDYLAGLGTKKRYAFNAAMRHFDKWAPPADVRVERATTPAELSHGMGILADLHSQRWQAGGGEGAFAAARFRAFHERYARTLLERGQLGLAWLTVRGEPVAAMYNFLANHKVYFYQCGRKMDVPPRVRLGIVMCILTCQHAMNQGLKEFDFLAGNYAYKSEFTELSRPLIEVRVARGWREGVRRTVRWTWELLRKARRSGPATAAAFSPPADKES